MKEANTITKPTNVMSFKLSAVQRQFVAEIARLGNLGDAVLMQKDTLRSMAKKIGKRTPEDMAAIGQGVLKLYQGTAKVTVENGLQFSNNAAQQWYKTEISVLLPSARKSKSTKKGAKKAQGSKRVDHAERVEVNFTATLKNHKSITLAQTRKIATDAWYAAHPRSAK